MPSAIQVQDGATAPRATVHVVIRECQRTQRTEMERSSKRWSGESAPLRGLRDAGQTLAYSIASTSLAGAFTINATTGRITVANVAALDFETTPTFSLTVRVTDNGIPALFRDAIVTVSLTDVVEPFTVGLDVVPGDATNTFRRTAKFDIAILSTATFDARQVNVSSVRFGKLGTENSLTLSRGLPVYSYRDVNGDGRLDLVVNIDGSKTGLAVGNTLAKFTGLMTNGRQLLGSSTVIVKK